MQRPEYIGHVTNIVAFLVWLEKDNPNVMYGARHIRDAVNSMAAIMGVDPVVLRERMLLDEPKAGDDRHG